MPNKDDQKGRAAASGPEAVNRAGRYLEVGSETPGLPTLKFRLLDAAAPGASAAKWRARYVGERLKQVMALRQKTQADLARLIEVSQSAVSRILSGERKATSEQLDRIAAALSVRREDLEMPAEVTQAVLDHLAEDEPLEGVPDSLLSFLHRHQWDVTPRERRMLESVGLLTPSEELGELGDEFWQQLLDAWRDALRKAAESKRHT